MSNLPSVSTSTNASMLSVPPVEQPIDLETSCGWKGTLCQTNSNTDFSSKHSTLNPNENDESTRSTSSRTESDEDFDVTRYMGGEPSLLDIDVEYQGIRDIRKALTSAERTQLDAFDTTMLIRHLRAEKGDVAKATAQIKATLQWRTDFGVDVIVSCFAVQGTVHDTPAHDTMRTVLRRENASAKIYSRGHDSHGRALLYMTPARENTHVELDNMRHLVWNLEKAIACTARQSVRERVAGTDDGATGTATALEKIHLLIDYDGFRLSDAPPMSTTRYTLDILQKHYPERMQHAFLLNPPFVFRAFWALIKGFVDPVTKAKIVFCSGTDGPAQLTSQVADRDKLEVRAYGSNPDIRPFESSEYVELPFDVSFDEG